MKYIKEVGYFRTGTNFVQWLINKNFSDVKVLVNHFGYKHGNPANFFNNYDIDSKFNSFGNKTTLDATKSIKGVERENILNDWKTDKIKYVICVRDIYSWLYGYGKYKKTGFNEKYINEWNCKTREHYDFYVKNKENCVLIKHDNLVSEPIKILEKIEQKFGLVRKNEDYMVSKKKANKGGGLTNEPINIDYYKEKKYMETFNENQIKIVNKVVDMELYKNIW
jgi:hypothetical protein